MRVSGIAVMLFVMLLALCSFTPAAGAIFIEGQSIPDDGMVHILAAEDGSAIAPGPAVTGNPDAGLSGLGRAFPSLLAGDILPAMMPFEGISKMPNNTLSLMEEEKVTGDTIGHMAPSPIAGYWNFVDPGSIQANMPVLKSLFA